MDRRLPLLVRKEGKARDNLKLNVKSYFLASKMCENSQVLRITENEPVCYLSSLHYVVEKII